MSGCFSGQLWAFPFATVQFILWFVTVQSFLFLELVPIVGFV